jgi:nitroreductase
MAPMGELADVVTRQRACRSFSDEPVDDPLVERCLRLATHAPSAENRQPWVFVVVRDLERRRRLGEVIAAVWRGGARRISEARLDAPFLAEVDRGAEGGIAGAPVLVVVCGDASTSFEATLPSSIYPAVQNLLLAATDAGLGSAMTTLGTSSAAELRELLALPEHLVPMAIVPLGFPAAPLGPPRRIPVAERTHREQYGSPWTEP